MLTGLKLRLNASCVCTEEQGIEAKVGNNDTRFQH